MGLQLHKSNQEACHSCATRGTKQAGRFSFEISGGERNLILPASYPVKAKWLTDEYSLSVYQGSDSRKVGGTSTDGLHFYILTSASLRAIRHCPGPQM